MNVCLQILELLWSLAHLPHISREMVELALDAHSSILIESYHTKESERRTYISKCVEDIRKVHSLFPQKKISSSMIWPLSLRVCG